MTEKVDYGLRFTVRYFYDIQRLRVAAKSRPGPKGKDAEIMISKDDALFLEGLGDGLLSLEHEALKRVRKQLKRYPIYQWLSEQKGCGPTMSGVLLSEININRCNTVSALWHFAGLSVDSQTHKAVRRKKGEKVTYSPFLRDKMLGVLSECLIKCNSPWRKFYDDYKHRKKTTMVKVCMGCANKPPKEKKECKRPKCKNCEGKVYDVPWGASDLHRANAAKRYMIKMFLMEMWVKWRTLEGLDTRPPYCVEYLGVVHHG